MILVRATDGAKVAAELLDFKRCNTDPATVSTMTQEALIVGNAPSVRSSPSLRLVSLNPDDQGAGCRLQPLPGRGLPARWS